MCKSMQHSLVLLTFSQKVFKLYPDFILNIKFTIPSCIGFKNVLWIPHVFTDDNISSVSNAYYHIVLHAFCVDYICRDNNAILIMYFGNYCFPLYVFGKRIANILFY